MFCSAIILAALVVAPDETLVPSAMQANLQSAQATSSKGRSRGLVEDASVILSFSLLGFADSVCGNEIVFAIDTSAAGFFAQHLSKQYLRTGLLSSSRGQFKEADGSYRIAKSLDPSSFEVRLALANNYLHMKNNQAALEEFDAAIWLVPNHGQVYAGRAVANIALRNFRSALRDLDRAIALGKSDPDVYYNRGIANAGLGNTKLALGDYSTAIRLNPRNSDALANRALVYFQMEAYESALDDARGALALNKEDEVAQSVVGMCSLARKDFKRAVDALSVVIKKRGPQSDAAYYRGIAHAELGEFDSAIEDFSEVLKRKPKWAACLVYKAQCEVRNKDWGSSLADFEKAAVLDPQNAAAHMGIAWIRAVSVNDDVRDAKAAMEHATKACEITKWKESFCLSTIAAACAESGDFPKAVEYQEKALLDANYEKRFGVDCRARLELFKGGKPYRE